MTSNATTVDDYLEALPDDRRETVTAVRDLVRRALPEGFEEQMEYGMIAWVVPLSTVADTYNGKPLTYAALASQKNYCSLYLMGLYTGGPGRIDDQQLRQRWAGGRRLDLGKSCIRFRAVDDLDAALLAEVIGQWTMAEYAEAATAAHAGRKGR